MSLHEHIMSNDSFGEGNNTTSPPLVSVITWKYHPTTFCNREIINYVYILRATNGQKQRFSFQESTLPIFYSFYCLHIMNSIINVICYFQLQEWHSLPVVVQSSLLYSLSTIRTMDDLPGTTVVNRSSMFLSSSSW